MSPPCIEEVGDASTNTVAIDAPGGCASATITDSSGKSITNSSRKGRVVQRNYVLNDTAALKKKLRHETRKDPYNMGTEARNGSNIVMELRTSFFEHVKAKFVNDLLGNDGIKHVENAQGAKASTESSGDAYVEYTVDIVFQVQDKEYTVKLTAYTTSCRVMFQPVGDPPQTRIQPSNKSIPRFFADTYFLPWCQETCSNETYNETIKNEMMDAIRSEIKRLDLTKMVSKKVNTRGRLTSVPNSGSETKCVARGCKYTGIQTNNKNAVGMCAKCGGFEHFECSKTKQEDREDILKGVIKYFCSLCFASYPSMIAFNFGDITQEIRSPTPSRRSMLQITASTTAVPVESVPPPVVPVVTIVDPEIKYVCKSCDYEAESKEKLNEHKNDNHVAEIRQNEPECISLQCTHCDWTTIDKSELEVHVKGHIECASFSCTLCDNIFDTKLLLDAHHESTHSTKCPKCNLTFIDKVAFSKHVERDHAPKCTVCDIQFSSKTELETHMNKDHGTSSPNTCTICSEICETQETLNQHKQEKHNFVCQICHDIFTDESELNKHITTTHMYKCSLCEVTSQTLDAMENHKIQAHYIQCPMCPTKVKDIHIFSSHFKQEHIHSCRTCGKEFENPKDLEEHNLSEHNNHCGVCEETFETKSSLTKHMHENHSEEIYKCEICAFEGRTRDSIESHILEEHYTPDENGKFSCDECSHKCDSRQSLREHFHQEHKDELKNTGTNTETENAKHELKLLKNNFKRLESMFHDSLEEMDKVKTEYEAKLLEANEKYRATLAENEELKEKVEVLFKLGRSYINRKNETQNNEETLPVTDLDGSEAIVIEDNDLNEENDEGNATDDLRAWTQSKMRGFKRVSPSESAARSSTTKNPPARSSRPPATSPTTVSPPASRSPTPTNLKEKENLSQTGTKRALYCHYFSNYGKCLFEERTGGTCKFLHKAAPMCQNGVSCQRSKCMYKHPNMNFLDQRQSLPRSVSPWQMQMPVPMMNPWMTQNQLMSPWNMEVRRR